MTTETANPAPAPLNHAGVRQRAAAREMSQRRRRVIVNVVFFVVATTAMLMLSLITRDSHAFKRSEAFAQDVAQHLNENFGDRPLPHDMPMPSNMSESLRESRRNAYVYRGQPLRREAILQDRPRAVCYPVYPLRLFLQPSGRHIILATPDGFEVLWLRERDVVNRAEELGIKLINPAGN